MFLWLGRVTRVLLLAKAEAIRGVLSSLWQGRLWVDQQAEPTAPWIDWSLVNDWSLDLAPLSHW